MGLGSALVDRARAIRHEQSAQKIDGRTQQLGQTTGPWFRCRFEQAARPRSKDGNRTRAASNPTIMCGPRDENGDPVSITVQDEIEVEAEEVDPASGRFRVAGDPEPIRKKRTLIGWSIPLKRVEADTPPTRPRIP